MRQLRIITAQPNDLLFCWQVRVQLHNLRKYGLSENYTALIWKHNGRQNGEMFTEQWAQLMYDYPEAAFFHYEDSTGELSKLIAQTGYIPLLRPWLLAKHFESNLSLREDAILYMDSDVIFTKKPNFDNLLGDDTCYLSDTRSYIAASYFDSKIKDVLPQKLDSYKKIDVLDDLLKEFDLSRQVAIANEQGSGGAQYLLKNIDAGFWQDVFKGCITVRLNLRSVNKRFFENEDKGFQSWCADMWSVLFNLWKRGMKTECPPEMDFCWATDPIDKWDKVQIYHDAGASTRPIKEGHMLFHKRDLPYVNNEKTPFDDDLSFVSNEYCSYWYAREIEDARWALPPLKGVVDTFTGEFKKRSMEELEGLGRKQFEENKASQTISWVWREGPAGPYLTQVITEN